MIADTRPRGESSQTLIELLWFVGSVGLGTWLALWAGHKIGWFGYPLGFILGAAILPGLGYALGWLYDWTWWGRPPRPDCRSGKCHSEDYELRRIPDGDFDWFCRCGGRYRKRGRRFFEVLPDGSPAPYMRWRAFKGWFPESQ
jgi:hypothetical protein